MHDHRRAKWVDRLSFLAQDWVRVWSYEYIILLWHELGSHKIGASLLTIMREMVDFWGPMGVQTRAKEDGETEEIRIRI